MVTPALGLALWFTFLLMVRTGMRRTFWLLIFLTLVACSGGAGDEPTPSPVAPISLAYDRRAGALVLEADTYGGLVPPPLAKHVAEVRIYGDGQVVLGEEEMLGVGTDRLVTTGHISEEELGRLVRYVADQGFFQLEERYQPSPAPTDLPSRWVTVNLVDTSKSVTVYPPDCVEAPLAFRNVYAELLNVRPPDGQIFTATSGTMTAIDLGSIDELPSGQRNQVAPWDTPLVGMALAQATEGAFLAGEEYQAVEEFLLRYPAGQLFGSQEGRAYQVRLEAYLPWEDSGQ